MDLLYLYSYAFIVISLFPLWFDANRRKEYGARPKILFVSLAVFICIGLISLAAYMSGALKTDHVVYAFFLILALYPFATVIAEYSIHHQRIKKNLLEQEFQNRLKIGIIIAAGVVVLCGLLFLLHACEQTKTVTNIANAIGFIFFIGIIIFNLFGIVLFDLESGVIRRKMYTFISGAVLSTLIFIILFAYLVLPAFNSVGLVYTFAILMNLIFAFRVCDEYFLHRMQHLNANYNQHRMQDIARTELINKVLVSTPEEDIQILKNTLTGYLKRLQDSIANPNMKCKSMMMFRRNGDILSVDSGNLIIDYCLPLINQESLKRMKHDMAQEHIMTQIFNLDELQGRANPDGLDFASAAIWKMMLKKEAVIIDPIPQYLGMIFRSIVLYPIFNQGKLNAMLVIFKDTSDYVFPQERVIIEDLVSNLAISTTLIDGKRMQEDKNRLNQEMDVAKLIQVSILPRKIAMEGYDIATEMITATEVGGDLFDFVPTSFANYIDIGDVAGHGLPAGMTALIHMAAFHGALRASEMYGKPLETTQLYNIVNQVLITINRDRIGSDKFMTCNIMAEKNGKFKYAGSHMIALVYRASADSVEQLSGTIDHAAYLGISEFADSSQSLGEFALDADDVLILYTDGLTESRDRYESFFGLENLSLALKTNAALPSEDIKVAILKALEIFSESGDLHKYGGNYADDVSILVIKRK